MVAVILWVEVQVHRPRLCLTQSPCRVPRILMQIPAPSCMHTPWNAGSLPWSSMNIDRGQGQGTSEAFQDVKSEGDWFTELFPLHKGPLNAEHTRHPWSCPGAQDSCCGCFPSELQHCPPPSYTRPTSKKGKYHHLERDPVTLSQLSRCPAVLSTLLPSSFCSNA